MSATKAAMILPIALTAAPARAQSPSQHSSNIEAVQILRGDEEGSFIRPNLSYTFPGVSAYAFGEFYRGNGYFGKVAGNRTVSSGLSVTGEFVYDSDAMDRLGLGVSYSVPAWSWARMDIKLLPFWANYRELDLNRVMAGYSGDVNLPLGFGISSFGEANLDAPEGSEWGYGEIWIRTPYLGRFSLGAGLLLKNNGDGVMRPRVEQAVTVRFDVRR